MTVLLDCCDFVQKQRYCSIMLCTHLYTEASRFHTKVIISPSMGALCKKTDFYQPLVMIKAAE